MSINTATIKSFFIEAGKDSPVVGLGAAHFAGVTVSDWLVILGLLYGVVRLGVLVLDAYWKWKDRRLAGK